MASKDCGLYTIDIITHSAFTLTLYYAHAIVCLLATLSMSIVLVEVISNGAVEFCTTNNESVASSSCCGVNHVAVQFD